MAFPGDSEVNKPPANAGDSGWTPGLRRSPGKENGNPLQYSCWRFYGQRSLEDYSPWDMDTTE